MIKQKNMYLCGILLTTTILSGIFLTSQSSLANSAVSNGSEAAVSVSFACIMSGTVTQAHSASVSNNTYASDIGNTNIKVQCNDNSGFAIYATGFTDNTFNNKMLGANNREINTGTATSGDNSAWAMKLSTDSTATYPITLEAAYNNVYANIPANYTKVASRLSGTDVGSSATGASISATYQVYISPTQFADAYSGKVKYTVVHPATETPAQPQVTPANQIGYYPNTQTASGQMSLQPVGASTDIRLLPSNFARRGYGFAGWNDKYDYTGNNYGPIQTITTPETMGTTGLSLYAHWIESAGGMRNWNGCGSMARYSVTALTDERDDNTYAIAKLADDKCWMIENLRLDNSVVLSAVNTHNPSLPLINDSSTHATSDSLSPHSASWCNEVSSACIDQSRLFTDNTTEYLDNTTGDRFSNIYSYGNYYNWYSATAGSGTYSTLSANATGDLCPAGWHLPTGGASGELSALDIASGGTGDDQETAAASIRNRTYPYNLVYSGFIDGDTVSNRGGLGYYWTSTSNWSNSAYYADIADARWRPGVGLSDKYRGLTVRCVADNSL